MITERVLLDKPLPRHYAAEVERRIFFVSDAIVDFKLDRRDDLIHSLEVTTERPVEGAELSAKINAMVASDVLSQRSIPRKVVWQSPIERAPLPDTFARMVEQEVAGEVGEGQIWVGQPFLKLLSYFDRQLAQIAIGRLGGREYRYPTLIPTSALKKCGYFSSFPQYLMFVTRLHGDIDTYRAFLERCRAGEPVESFALDYCDNLDYCLPPTMCFHTYHQYRDRQLDGNMVVTSRGKSFRFESRYRRTLERLWDFTIREIVFMGSREFVLDCRERFMEQAIRFIEGLELSGFCEVANDPFFCNLDTADKIWSQKVLELKYELRLHVAPDRTIAVGSFNFHEHFFGEGFNIRHDDAWVRTACVGFGLERLVYAFLCQYGLNERDWPTAVREGVQGE